MRPSAITPDPDRGDRGGCLFGAVFILTGEGACARPGGSAYPHYCSLLTRVDSAEADRLVARDSASAPTSVVAIDEGVRHYRTTPGALNFLRFPSCGVLLQAAAATAQPITTNPQIRPAPAPSACLPRRANSLRGLTRREPGHSRCARSTSARQRPPFLHHHPPPFLLLHGASRAVVTFAAGPL